MAKVKYGAMVTDARGSVDGIVYSKNQYGGYVRQKVSPVQPRTSRQQEVRNSFGALSKEYSNTLVDTDRTLWKQFAKNNPITDVFGNSQVLNAISMYQRVNRVLHELGLPSLTQPPINMDVESFPSVIVHMKANDNGIWAETTGTLTDPLNKLYTHLTPPLPGGVTNIQPYLFFANATESAISGTPCIYQSCSWPFALPRLGQRYGWKVQIANTRNGALSVGHSGICVVEP